jgi:hypothetical protein
VEADDFENLQTDSLGRSSGLITINHAIIYGWNVNCVLSNQGLTNDKPDLSSERASHRDKTVNLEKKKKKISGQKSQIGLDTKTY